MFAIVLVLMARNVPSFSRGKIDLGDMVAAMRVETNDSARFAVHLTARFSFRDANVQNASSA